MTAMLQVVFMAIGLAVLTFVIAFLFRKWQRAILWAVALLLFVGTSILLGAGVLKIYENGMMNHAVLLGITLSYACSFIFIYGAEKLHKALRQNCSTSETSIAQPVQVVDEGLVQPEQSIEKEMPQPEQDNNEELVQPEHKEVEEHVELQGRLNTPLALQVFSCQWLICKKAHDDLCSNLMRMLFIIFCKQIVYTLYTTIKYLIHMSILWAIARTYYAATIVTSLIPVSYFHKALVVLLSICLFQVYSSSTGYALSRSGCLGTRGLNFPSG